MAREFLSVPGFATRGSSGKAKQMPPPQKQKAKQTPKQGSKTKLNKHNTKTHIVETTNFIKKQKKQRKYR